MTVGGVWVSAGIFRRAVVSACVEVLACVMLPGMRSREAYSGCFYRLRAILRSTQQIPANSSSARCLVHPVARHPQPRSRIPDSAPRTLLGWARETCTGVPPMPQASQRGITRPSSLLSPDHMASVRLSFFLAMATPLLLCLLALAATSAAADVGGTIGFATVGRMNFHFDVYTLTLPAIDTLGGGASGAFKETRVTLGESVSYNAQLVESQWDSAVVEDLRRHGHDLQGNEAPELLVYVSEIEGIPQLYLDIPLQGKFSLNCPSFHVRVVELLNSLISS